MGESGGEDTHWNRLRCEATHQTPTHQGRTAAWGWGAPGGAPQESQRGHAQETNKKYKKQLIRLNP